MKISEILRAAGQKIMLPEQRCTGPYARDAEGLAVGCEGPSACSYCAMGALYATWQPRAEHFIARDILTNSASVLGYRDTVDLNESTNAQLTGDLYSEAIECAEALEEMGAL